MASTTEPNFGLQYGWALGESGWNEGMDANLLKLARVGVHLSVLDRDLTAPPASPNAGDAYIVGPSATGDWSTHDNKIALWDGTEWVFYLPNIGWIVYIVDEEVLSAYKAAGWSTGISI